MLQRSSRNSAVCHHILAVAIKPIHNYVMLQKPGWNKGAETQKHEEGECERRNMHQPHASSQTHHPAIPQQRGDHHSTQTHTDKLSKCTGRMPQNQANEWSTKGKTTARERERKEYLALPSGVRDLGKRKQTQRKRTEREGENRGTPILQLYCHFACFAWWQTMTITLKAKLSQEHLKAFSCERQIITEQQHMQILNCLLWNSH